MKFIAILLIILAAAKHSFAQDTTGGTRPTIIIPLHKTAEKKTAADITSEKVLPTKGSPSLNATDSKLHAAAASKKYRRKAAANRKGTFNYPHL